MSFLDSVSRFISTCVPVYAPSHLSEDQKAKMLKVGRENDDQQFINKKAISEQSQQFNVNPEQQIAQLAKCINKEGVFRELREYQTYNAHHISNAKSPEEKYQAALKYINCSYAIDDLRAHNAGGKEYLINQYQRCEGLKYLLDMATKK